MNDHGYTLAEMLAALVMIGLAVGGLTMGVRVIGHGEAQVAHATTEGGNLRTLQDALSTLLNNAGPFRTKDNATFQGAGSAFSFICSAPTPCSASLTKSGEEMALQVRRMDGSAARFGIVDSGPMHFEYVGSQSRNQNWPPPPPISDVLRSVELVRDADGAAIASTRIWREQPADCAFDPISGDCRAVAP